MYLYNSADDRRHLCSGLPSTHSTFPRQQKQHLKVGDGFWEIILEGMQIGKSYGGTGAWKMENVSLGWQGINAFSRDGWNSSSN